MLIKIITVYDESLAEASLLLVTLVFPDGRRFEVKTTDPTISQ
jgi:hypothetical protein